MTLSWDTSCSGTLFRDMFRRIAWAPRQLMLGGSGGFDANRHVLVVFDDVMEAGSEGAKAFQKGFCKGVCKDPGRGFPRQ